MAEKTQIGQTEVWNIYFSQNCNKEPVQGQDQGGGGDVRACYD